jgi:hypothetical protein
MHIAGTMPLHPFLILLVMTIKINRKTQRNRAARALNSRRRLFCRRPRFVFNSLKDYEVKRWFRFSKAEIRRLLPLLGLPEEVRTAWRSKCSSLEALCICLFRLSYANKWDRCVLLFGRAPSHLAGINLIVMEHLVTRFGHLLKMPAYFTEPARLRYFADAMWAKGCRFGHCVGFIDGTLRRMARPKEMQRSVYNGHKKYHGIKFQNVTFADGMIVDQHGPYAGRRSDPYMMGASGICARLNARLRFQFIVSPGVDAAQAAANLQLHTPLDVTAPTFFSVNAAGNPTHIQYMIFGDKGYHAQPSGCILVPYKRYGGHELDDDELSFNRDMSTVRISVEWGFNKVVQQWGYLDNFKQLKAYKTPVAGYYIAATLLTNFHTCLHGNQTATYLNVEPPILEEYLGW